jgi:uncharacterized protein YbaA (DUF1428 family)
MTIKGGYIDGFVFPVPKKNTAAYKKMAEWGKRTWMKHGALAYFECQGDDLTIKPGPDGTKARSFVDTAQAKPTDNVWFSFIVFKDKKHRDAVNKKVMAEMSSPANAKKWKDFVMPMDAKQMSYGGFKAIVKG